MRSRGCAGGRRRAATPSAGEFRRFTEFYLVFFSGEQQKNRFTTVLIQVPFRLYQ